MQSTVILINKISDSPTEDELDVLDQAQEIENALISLGYKCRIFMDLDLKATAKSLDEIRPVFVFNLVESLEGKANLIHLAPALLDSLKIPYTGCRLESMFITSNKPLAKNILAFNGIDTPAFLDSTSFAKLKENTRYIAKPLWEDASVGINDSSVFIGKDSAKWADLTSSWTHGFFVEEFIEGREFNLSLLGNGTAVVTVLPPAEILFLDFPKNKPKILGYSAKWDKDAFEYINTPRHFDFPDSDFPLLTSLSDIAVKSWNILGLKGYARVDFRISENNIPYVLEINANPCLAPDAGFYAAAQRAGFSFNELIQRIVKDAFI